MPDIALDLRYLKYALVVAEHGSFRRAADVLNISQSTITRRIQLLERRLGVSLFERNHMGARPTSAGARFMRDAAVGAEHMRMAINGLAVAQRGELGELRIGLMASLADGFLSDLLGTFRRTCPQVEVQIEEGTSQGHAAGVSNGRLDVAFVTGVRTQQGCETERLWNEDIFVALPNSHPLAKLAAVAWEDLRKEPFLVTAEAAGPDIEDFLVRRLSTDGFRPRISVQRVGRENLLNMVAKGFGLTLTTNSTLGAVYPGVVFLPCVDPHETVSSSVIWSAANQNPALKRLLDLSFSTARRWGDVAK